MKRIQDLHWKGTFFGLLRNYRPHFCGLKCLDSMIRRLYNFLIGIFTQCCFYFVALPDEKCNFSNRKQNDSSVSLSGSSYGAKKSLISSSLSIFTLTLKMVGTSCLDPVLSGYGGAASTLGMWLWCVWLVEWCLYRKIWHICIETVQYIKL